MKRKKRVKFVGRSNFRPGRQQQPIPSTSTDGGDCPKTLEYKSFLRLVQETGRGSSSSWKEDKRNTLVQQAHAEEPAKQKASLSPTNHLADKRTSIFSKSIESQAIPCSKKIESQAMNGGTFYTKRQNLVKLVASVLSLEESEINSKGHDVIPALLNRLRINKEYKDNDNSEYPRVTILEDQSFPDKESFAETDLSSCSWKKYDETCRLREQSVAPHLPIKKKYQTMEPMIDREIVAYSGPSQRDFHVPLLRWDGMDDERDMTLVSESHVNNEVYQRPLALYNHGYSSSLTYTDPSFGDFNGPLLRWGGMDGEREIHATFEGWGNNLVDQWPLTVYDHGFGGTYSNSLAPPEDYLSTWPSSKWGEYMSTSFYEDCLSRTFHLHEIDEGIDDEGGTSMIKWTTPE